MSLRELWNEQQAATRRIQMEMERDLVLAVQIERISILAQQKNGGRKLPDVEKLLTDMRQQYAKGTRQTRAEQVAVIHAMRASLGVDFVRLRKGPDGRYHAVT